MPRGVYDRSLTKEQRAALKEGKTPKRKYTRKAAAVTAAAPKRKYTKRTDASPEKATSNSDSAFVLMGEIRNNLASLSQVQNTFGTLPSLAEEAEAQIVVLGQIREKLFSEQSESAKETAESVDDGEIVDEVQAHPVHLPPPPPIAPVLPTPH